MTIPHRMLGGGEQHVAVVAKPGLTNQCAVATVDLGSPTPAPRLCYMSLVCQLPLETTKNDQNPPNLVKAISLEKIAQTIK